MRVGLASPTDGRERAVQPVLSRRRRKGSRAQRAVFGDRGRLAVKEKPAVLAVLVFRIRVPHHAADASAESASDTLEVVQLVAVGTPQQHATRRLVAIVGAGQRNRSARSAREAPGDAVTQSLRVTAFTGAPAL